MERELWNVLYQYARELDDLWKEGPHTRYDAHEIVGVYLWAVIWDRPTSWACQRENWGSQPPPESFPSQSTMSRRLRSPRVQQLWDRLDREMCQACQAIILWLAIVDGKPLTVSIYSKDPTARWGKLSRTRWARGYKLHAIWGSGAAYPLAWDVRSLNESEVTVALELLPKVPPGKYMLGDKVHDSNRLYEAAAACGLQLVAPQKQKGSPGHRRQSPHRLRAIELLNHPYGEDLYAERGQIEQQFGRLTNFAGGLAPLPNWVRHHRVKPWVGAKLLINAVRDQLLTESQMTAAA